MGDPVVWVADVGSIRKNNFGWYPARFDTENVQLGTDIGRLATGVAEDLLAGNAVALGFECPLFLPVADDALSLTSARDGEGDRPWSAGAGAGSLVIGLTESVWVLERIRLGAGVKALPTLDWESFASGGANLFLWEAFVTNTAKVSSHAGDAEVAAKTFMHKYPKIAEASAVEAQNPFNLVGAALLRSGLTTDLRVLHKQCIVIKS